MKMNWRRLRLTLIGFAVLGAASASFLVGCAPERVDEVHRPRRIYSAYRHALMDIEIERSALGRGWMEAADRAFTAAELVSLPVSTTAVFDPAEPEAAAVRFRSERGRSVSIRLIPDARPPLFFADLYRVLDDGERVKVASIDPDQQRIEFRARRSATYLLRVQPELGRGGRIEIRVEQQ